MVQGGDQHIRIGGGEELLVMRAREAEGGHPSRLGRLDPGHRVRNAEALLRRHAQLFAPREEHLRMRLPLREVAARYIGVEDSRRVSPGFTRSDSRPFSSATSVHADLAQEEARIVGGGDRGDVDPGVSLSR